MEGWRKAYLNRTPRAANENKCRAPCPLQRGRPLSVSRAPTASGCTKQTPLRTTDHHYNTRAIAEDSAVNHGTYTPSRG